MLEIESIAVVRRSDYKVRLMEARQGLIEPIRTSADRLRGLAYKCNLSTECPNQYCTISNVNITLLSLMVKGLVDQDIERELFSQSEEMDLENTITFVEIREGDRMAGPRNRKSHNTHEAVILS